MTNYSRLFSKDNHPQKSYFESLPKYKRILHRIKYSGSKVISVLLNHPIITGIIATVLGGIILLLIVKYLNL